jgi:hypothetical protein
MGLSSLLFPRFHQILGIFQINACDLTDQFYCRHLIAGEEVFQSIKEGKWLTAVRTGSSLTTHLRFARPARTKLLPQILPFGIAGDFQSPQLQATGS